MPIDNETPVDPTDETGGGSGGGGTSYTYGEPVLELVLLDNQFSLRTRLTPGSSTPTQVEATLNTVTQIATPAAAVDTWLNDFLNIIPGQVQNGNVTITFPDGFTRTTGFQFTHFGIIATATRPATPTAKGSLKLAASTNLGAFTYEAAEATAATYLSDATGNFSFSPGDLKYRVTQRGSGYNYTLENLVTGTLTLGEYQVPEIPTEFGVTQAPSFVQAVYNPIRINMVKAPYKVGDLCFVEVWKYNSQDAWTQDMDKEDSILLGTLVKAGKGNGNYSFDVSSLLASQFTQDTAFVPNASVAFQKDSTAYLGYFLKAGFISLNPDLTLKYNYEYESPSTHFALRAALPLDASGDMSGYVYQFDGDTVDYLTNLPSQTLRRRDENTLLPLFLPLNRELGSGNPKIRLKADIRLLNGTLSSGYVLGEYSILTGGVYLLNAKPQFLVNHPDYEKITSYSVYLEYQDEANPVLQMTKAKELRIAHDIDSPTQVTYMNPLGGWDSLEFTRELIAELKTESTRFTSSAYGQRTYAVQANTTVTYYSPPLSSAEYLWLQDLKTSPAVYIQGRYQNLESTDYSYDSQLGLFTFELKVTPAQQKNTIRL